MSFPRKWESIFFLLSVLGASAVNHDERGERGGNAKHTEKDTVCEREEREGLEERKGCCVLSQWDGRPARRG